MRITSHAKYEIALPPKSSLCRITLFLDLDETLVKVLPTHLASETIVPRSAFEGAFSFLLGDCAKPRRRLTVFKRRGLDSFLSYAAENFEVVIYTAAKKEYAEKIIDALDPEKNIYDLPISGALHSNRPIQVLQKS